MNQLFVDVDVQRDFCEPDGALYVAGSPNEVLRRLVRHAADKRIPILGSVDSHAWDAWEFASSGRKGPNGEQPNFPDHCVKGTPGWLKVEGTLPKSFRFVPNVVGAPIENIVDEVLRGDTRGVYFEKEVYSLFANPVAESFLRQLVQRAGTAPEFFVFGVATDYCVRAAALGLAERGYRAVLLTDAIAGITPRGVEDALAEMKTAGVRLTTTAELFS
jgi:nicotinamidase/pyrazinamidase